MEVRWWPLLPFTPILRVVFAPRRWVREFLVEIRSSWKFFLGMLIGTVAMLTLFLILLSRVEAWLRHHAEWIKSHLAMALACFLGLLVLPFLVLALRHLLDYCSWIHWRRNPPSSLTVADLTAVLSRYHTRRFRVLVLNTIRQQGRLSPNRETEQGLIQLAARIERAPSDPTDSENTDHLNWGPETADAIYKLVDQVSETEIT